MRAVWNRWNSRERFPILLGALLALAYFVYGAANVHKHSISADAPSLFRSSDRVLYWIENGFRSRDLDLDAEDPTEFQSPFDYYPDAADRFHYPIFPAFVGTLTSRLVQDELNLMDHADAHNLGLVLLNAVAIFFFTVYASAFLGRRAGSFAALALLFFPAALGHAFNNPKDWPCAQFYALSILACGAGVVAQRVKHLLAGAIFAGIAFSAKLNEVFGIATLGVWAPIAYFVLFHRRDALKRSVIVTSALVPVIAFLVFFITWPWLYHGSVWEWGEHIGEYVRFLAAYGVSDRDTWIAYPFWIAVCTAPPLVLVAASIGLFAGWESRQRTVLAKYSLIVLWLFVPLTRIAAPRSNFYDLNRHFIEYIPALCALAGVGFSTACKYFAALLAERGTMLRTGLLATLLAMCLVGFVAPVVHVYPFESLYFNALTEGLGGAQARGISQPDGMTDWRVPGCEGDYWYSTVRIAREDAQRFGARDEDTLICGPTADNVMAWSEGLIGRMRSCDTTASYGASHVIVIPREGACCWSAIRQLERERRILHRVELDGGLVYEILGEYEGPRFEPTSTENRYTRLGNQCNALRLRPPPPLEILRALQRQSLEPAQ